MDVFAVELYLPGVARADLPAVAERARRAAAEADSGRVAYLEAVLLPEDETCFLLFEGPSEAHVREATRRAGFEHERVVPAVALPRRR